MWLGLVGLLGLPGKTAFANRRGFSHFMLLLSFFFFFLAALGLENLLRSGGNKKLQVVEEPPNGRG